MIRTLRVRDFAVIEAADLEFDDPFVVLTGETGAGKSLLVDALGLLSGGRAASGLVRAGAKRLLVEGEVDGPFPPALRARLAENGIELAEGEPLLLRREVTASGRSRAWVADSLVGIGFLAEVAAQLIRIRGQNEAPDLADAASARDALDLAGGLSALRGEMEAAWREWHRLDEECRQLEEGERDRESRLEFARFQLDEIRALAIAPDEEESLSREKSRLAHAARIGEAAGEAFDRLSEGEGSAAEQLGRARKALTTLAPLVPEVAELVEAVEEVSGRLTDLAGRMADLMAAAEPDPARLDEVSERLERIRRLVRKHGCPVAELGAKETTLAAEVAALEGASGDLARLVPRRDRALSEATKIAAKLSQARQKAAPKLARAVRRHLDDLAMSGTSLEFTFGVVPRAGSAAQRDGVAVELGPSGWDRVELLATTNPGEPPRPLGRIASGGELSRLQLALAAALLGSGKRLPQTVVFDEIDAGVGGAAAVAVGTKLRALAADDRILCVTHLATIAARAHRHFRVSKQVDGERTRVDVTRLEGNDRVDELARMLAGESGSPEARRHAEALLAGAAGV